MLLDIAYYLLILIAAITLVWYLYGWISGAEQVNIQWKDAIKSGNVTPQLRNAYRFYPDKHRFLLFWLQLNSLKNRKVPSSAAMAELGVYRGDTAFIMHVIDPDRELFLFDTFEGFTSEDLHNETAEASTYTTASFADTSIERVKEKLKYAPNVQIFKGDFKKSVINIPERSYAFVSIDVDLAEPTMAGLRYFYPRLCPGGVIVVHDYNHRWQGLMNAVDAFLDSIAEQPVLVPDTNNSLVLIKNK